MNSLDALISICFLFSGLAILLGAVMAQEQRIELSGDTLFTKGIVLKCSAITDSYFSNSAKTAKTTQCYEKDGKIIAEYKGNKKTMPMFDGVGDENYE